MNNHLSGSSPTLIPCQTTKFDILVNDIYNFGSSPPQTQESQDTSSSSEAESLGHGVSIADAFEFLKKNAPHLLRKQKAMQTLEKENADLKKTIKKLKEDLHKAKMELELRNLRKG